jgi:hypothetical protein
MKKVRRSGNWIIILSLLVITGASCDSEDTPENYTSIEGIYTCQETSSHSGVRQYPIEIDKVKNTVDQYIIINFQNKGENEFIFANLSFDTILIANQAIVDIIVNGKGLVGRDYRSIRLNYLTDDGITILDYHSDCTR